MKRKAHYRKQTERVKALLKLGKSNKEIAAILYRSERVVKWHVERLHKDAGCCNGPADMRRFMVWIVTGKLPGTQGER